MTQIRQPFRHHAVATPAGAALADIVTTWSDIRTGAGAQPPMATRTIPRPGAVLSFQYGDPLTLSLNNVVATRRSYLVGPNCRRGLALALLDERVLRLGLVPARYSRFR